MKENDYVSTNIRLPREQLKTLKHKAVEEGKSMGQVLREALSRGLESRTHPLSPPKIPMLKQASPFAKIVSLGDSGERDSGVNHDKYLYGKAKSEWKS